MGSGSLTRDLTLGLLSWELESLNTEPPEKSLLDNFKPLPGLLCLLPAIRTSHPSLSAQPTWESRSMTSDPQSSTTALTLAAAFLSTTCLPPVDTKLGPASGSCGSCFSCPEASPSDPQSTGHLTLPFSPLGPSPNYPIYSSPFCVPPAHAILGHYFLQGAVAMGKNLITFLIGVPTGAEAPGGQAFNSLCACLSLGHSTLGWRQHLAKCRQTVASYPFFLSSPQRLRHHHFCPTLSL